MPQLVGTNCIHCHGRIGNELDATFCSVCSQPRHRACAKPTPDTPDKCAECGAQFNAVKDAERRKAVSAAAPQPISLARTAREVGQLVRLGKFIVGGLALIALAAALVFHPDLRNDPNRIGFTEVLYGLVLVAGGIAFGAVGWWLYRKNRPPAPPTVGS